MRELIMVVFEEMQTAPNEALINASDANAREHQSTLTAGLLRTAGSRSWRRPEGKG